MGVPMMLYFADPMCSWCWGFNPVMARVREAYGERAYAIGFGTDHVEVRGRRSGAPGA